MVSAWSASGLAYSPPVPPVLGLLIHGLVFLTGAAGLVYQVVWQRYVCRLVGHDSSSVALILAVFLGGLSLGYWLCGRWSRRLTRLFRGYALLEAIIGLWALAFPALFAAVQTATRDWSFAPTLPLLAQGFLATVALTAVPALCMGGTIPLLTRGLAASLRTATRTHALIYGVNTAGACAGALLAGFWLITFFGLPGSLRLAAIANLLTAVIFALLPSPSVAPESEPAADPASARLDPSRAAGPNWAPYVIAFLSGACVMMLENVLIRFTRLSFGNSSHTFALIIAVFVGCIALGSLWVGRREEPPRHRLFWNQAGLALALLALFPLLDKGPWLAHLIRIGFQPNVVGYWLHHATVLAVLALILVLPVAFAGATLPLLFHTLKRDLPTLGATAGALFSLNAVGCVLGSLGGGLWLYAWLDSGGIFATAAVLAAVAALLAAGELGPRYRAAGLGLVLLALGVAVARPGFQLDRFAFGTFRVQSPQPYSLTRPATFYAEFNRSRQIRFLRDSASGMVSVIESPEQPAFVPGEAAGLPPGLLPLPVAPPATAGTNPPPLAIVVNGKSDSHVGIDRDTLMLTAHLPALYADRRDQALVIGLGTGVTAGELARYTDVAAIDVAEISPNVCAALPLFGASTGDVHRDPRLRLHVGDAFRVLGRSAKRWDLIVSEPSNPWIVGVDQLFSTDYYRLIREHLSPGGVFVQWVQQYGFSTEAFALVVNSVRTQFPRFTVFQSRKGDLVILARDRPFDATDRARIRRLLAEREPVRESLRRLGIVKVNDLLRRERPLLAALAGQMERFGVETLDRPRLHELAGRTFFTGEELGNEPITPFQTGTIIMSAGVLDREPNLPEDPEEAPVKDR